MLSRIFFSLGAICIGLSAIRFGPNLTVYDIAFMVALLLGIPTFAGSRYALLPSQWLMILGVIIAGCGFIASSLLRSSNPVESLFVVFRFLVLSLIFLALMPMAFVTRKQVDRLLICFSLSALLAGIGAVLQGILNSQEIPFGTIYHGRLSGFTEHPNELGMQAATSVLACLLVLRTKIVTGLYGVGIFFSACAGIVALLLSSSMTATASFVLGISLIIVFDILRLRTLSIGVFIGMFLTCILAYPFVSSVGDENLILTRISHFLSADESDTTLGSRKETYMYAWEGIAKSPIIGAGSATTDFLPIEDFFIHNIFLRAWFEGGVLAAIGFAIIFGSILIQFVRIAVFTETVDITALAGLVCLLIGCWFAPIFFQRIVWLFLAILALIAQRYQKMAVPG